MVLYLSIFFLFNSAMTFFLALFLCVQMNKRNIYEHITFICTSKKSSPSSSKLSSKGLVVFNEKSLVKPSHFAILFLLCADFKTLFMCIWYVHVSKCWSLFLLCKFNLVEFSSSTFFSVLFHVQMSFSNCLIEIQRDR